MADTVDNIVVYKGTRRYVSRHTNVSDGTGEAAVIKVSLAGLVGPDGTPPTAAVVEEVLWNIQGFTSVRLFWDHTTDDEIKVLTGGGYMDMRPNGGLMDPRTAGGTGDILFTTAGAVANATYDITIVLRLKD